jgi:ring-1,2-phenylacetyl-CoA epoxidase subunit PaaC
MFEVDAGERGLIASGVAADPAGLRAAWSAGVADLVGEATLRLPSSDWMQQGGRSGRHSEHLGHLLSELQSMQRMFPGVTW